MIDSDYSTNLINPEIFLSILDKLNLPIAIADKEGEFIWQSGNFEKIAHISSGKMYLDSILLSQSGKLISGEPVFLEHNGTAFKVEPFNISSNSPIFIFQIIKEQTLSNDKKLVKEIAHDFNNIFANILHSTELLKKSVSNKNKRTKLLGTIENNSSRGAEIIEDLLSSSDNSKKISRHISVRTLIQDILDSFQTTLPENIHLEIDITDDLGSVEGRYTDIYRALMNLIVNAKESIQKTGKIYLRAEKVSGKRSSNFISAYGAEPDHISIQIGDTGCGISEENLQKIFEEGFSTKNKNRESGLGLHIVRDIVQKHGGSIEVKSELNKGSIFQIYFPLNSEEPHSKYCGKGKTLLIAEDDLSLQELLVDLLESYNFNIITANNGLEVLEALNAGFSIDLLIIDRKMPVMDGIECIREIKRLGHDLPIIFASGSSMDEVELQESLKVNKILNKPYNFEKLLLYANELTG